MYIVSRIRFAVIKMFKKNKKALRCSRFTFYPKNISFGLDPD